LKTKKAGFRCVAVGYETKNIILLGVRSILATRNGRSLVVFFQNQPTQKRAVVATIYWVKTSTTSCREKRTLANEELAVFDPF